MNWYAVVLALCASTYAAGQSFDNEDDRDDCRPPKPIAGDRVPNCDAATSAVGDHVEHVATRNGVKVPVIVRMPNGTPVAAALLYPGGGGQLKIKSGLGQGAGNFMVRTRGDFAKHGIIAVVVDAPSDRSESLSEFRTTRAAGEDAAKLVSWARARWRVPVWIVGTSRGTISVGNAAAREAHADGIVLTSSVTYKSKKEKATLEDVAVDKIKGPVLLVHHVDDHCKASPPDGARDLRKRLIHAEHVELREISGGETCPAASPCSPCSHHGYYEQDAKVVDAIVGYIRRWTPTAH